ncbi:AEC family transporter [Waterburya agarophytonicola K14]|uniref:AEC family transporter n=1 Tax=Waterburya agarophytonicola KI4 TaxID=2874699 RepID=A0A964BS10_9CYAN|nr:AEC family transporter [Waterburya agarophytonicola]MCC0178653.1 AEC family transporter [Waterburya agarophytonicola KI4]
MTTLLPAVLPVGLIIAIGFIVGRTLPLERSTLSQLALYILSPALVVDSLYRTKLSWASSSKLLLGFALTSAIIYGTVWLTSKIFKLATPLSRGITAIVMFPNNGNMGLPVATFALGAAGLDRAIIYMLGSSFLMFCFGPAIIRGKGIFQGLSLTFKLPLIWAILLGIGLRLFRLELPWELDKGIQQLGAAAIPIALIVLGIQLSQTRFQPKLNEFFVAIARLAIAPTIAYFIGRLLQLEILDLQVLVLQSAMPTAVNSFIIVSEFGGDKDLVARAIVTSTLMSFVTLPIVLWLII